MYFFFNSQTMYEKIAEFVLQFFYGPLICNINHTLSLSFKSILSARNNGDEKKKQERDLFNNFIYRRTAMPAAASFISLLLIPTNYYKTILSFHSTLKFWKCLNDETGP